jgi:hypothetical protein
MEQTTNTLSTPAKPKRFRIERSTAGLLVLIGMALAGLGFMHFRTAPLVSLGATQTSAEAAIDKFLGGGQENIVRLQVAMATTRKMVESFNAGVAAARSDVDRDPFYNPLLSTPQKPNAKAVAQPGQRTNHADELRKLNIQSILVSKSRRAALVNGKLIQEGATIEQFKVEQIGDASVTFSRDGQRFELKLRK